ncbi:hypothetical protein HDV62DRAFT_136052 [Trichoderma sp. SZMC 28011]
MSTDDYDMMSRMTAIDTTDLEAVHNNGTYDVFLKAASGNPVTSDPTPEECSYNNKLTEMYTVMPSLRSLDGALSIGLSKLEDLVKEGDDAPPPEFSRRVLRLVPKDIQTLLAEITAFYGSPQEHHIQKLIEQQKLVATELKKNLSLAESYRTHVDSHGTMYVLENDLTNERLGTLEYKFLMKILKAPRKHYVWKEAADQISLLHPGEPPLVHEVLDILTKCLETTRLDQEKLDRLQNEDWEEIPDLGHWLQHTLCRISGKNVKDGASFVENKLPDKETFEINRFLRDLFHREDTVDLDNSYMHKLLKHVPPFTLLIPMLSLQQEDIEEEIRYHTEKLREMEVLKQKSSEKEADRQESLGTDDDFLKGKPTDCD